MQYISFIEISLRDVIAHACGRNQAAQPDSDLEDPLPLKLRSAVVSCGGHIDITK